MNLAVLFAPFALFLSGAGVQESANWESVSPLAVRRAPPEAWQIRVERRVQIRVAPRTTVPATPPRNATARAPLRSPAINPDEMRERKIGKCFSIDSIAGVQPHKSSRLLLFMRDRKMLSVEVERSCRSKDFYSGFYLSRTPDGQICIDRDSLLTRSGMTCRLTRIRQLVPDDR